VVVAGQFTAGLDPAARRKSTRNSTVLGSPSARRLCTRRRTAD
jgi:hypothetical protein